MHLDRRGVHSAARCFADYIDWRAEHPSDDLMTELLQRRVRGRDRHGADAHPRRDPHLRDRDRRRRQRDDHPPHRLGRQGAGRASRPAARAGRGPLAHPERDRGAPALRAAGAARRPATSPRDVELYGQTVPAGSAMLFLVGAANRDDRRYPDGDRFDIHREIGQHLTFGYGIHFCLGRRARPARGPGRARRGARSASPSGRSTGTAPSSPRPRRCAAGRPCRSGRPDGRTPAAPDSARPFRP